MKLILQCISPASFIEIDLSVKELCSQIQLCVNFVNVPNSGHLLISSEMTFHKLTSNFKHYHDKLALIYCQHLRVMAPCILNLSLAPPARLHLLMRRDGWHQTISTYGHYKSRCSSANFYSISMRTCTILTKSSIASALLVVSK